MNLEQFTPHFKKSDRVGFNEEAKLPTGKGCFVEVFKKEVGLRTQYTVVKTTHNVKGSNILFVSVEKLNKFLKNISRKK